MTDPERKLRQELAGLGNTPDEIADKLWTEGITGLRRSASYCPVAQYLRREYPSVSVSSTNIGVLSDGHGVVIGAPDPIVDFIYNFDTGSYLALDTEES
jgi:hypothetical protein